MSTALQMGETAVCGGISFWIVECETTGYL